MDFISKHIHVKKKGAVRTMSNEKLYNTNQNNDQKFPRGDQNQIDADAKKQFLKRSLSMRNYAKYVKESEENNWSAEDDINFNIERQIIKAKAQAKTVSIIEGSLYIDYQYVCPMPYGFRM